MLSKLLGSILHYPLRARKARSASTLYEAATAQREAGDFAAARLSLERAVALDPGHARARFWLGILLARDRAYADSAMHLERALAIEPGLPEGWIDLGNVHVMQRNLVKAAASFRAALAADPGSSLARVNLGWVLNEMGHSDEAVDHLRQVFDRAPEQENVLRNLVSALVASDRCEEALVVTARAVARNPAGYEARLLHGLAHQKLHDPVRALECYDAALAMRLDDAELYDNRGSAFLELGRLAEAIEAYDRALALRPDFALAAFHRALTHLLLKDYRRGWENYELRQLDRDYPQRASAYPSWGGESLAGRTVLIYREQGLGDEIMFASCLPEVIALAQHCIIECERRLLGLFRRSFPAATVYVACPDGSLPPEIVARGIDVAIPAGSLPRYLRSNLGDFPRHSGYLRADAMRVAHWRERLAALGPGLKVGISWTGGVRKTRRSQRSVPIERWQPILDTPDARFVSLQYTADAGAAVSALRDQRGVRITHWAEAIDDLDETAALVCALDLVVSVCTAVIHLAGALGRPVWVMAPYSPEWRYGFSGETMPWYPSVTVARQPEFGEWEPVILSVADRLRHLATPPTRALP